MSKSRCQYCNKPLHAGEWLLKRDNDGTVVKVCNDRKECAKRCLEQGKTLLGLDLIKPSEK